MTYPIRNLKEAALRLNQYQMEDRPLNLDESRELRDLIQTTLLAAEPVITFSKRQRMPPNVTLALQKLQLAIG